MMAKRTIKFRNASIQGIGEKKVELEVAFNIGEATEQVKVEISESTTVFDILNPILLQIKRSSETLGNEGGGVQPNK